MLRWIRDVDARLHARIESSMARRGILYPWWIPTVCVVGQLVAVLVALAQRDALWTPTPLVATVLLVAISPVIHLLLGGWLPWWLDGLGTLLAAVLLMATPVTSGIDLAPAILALLSAEAVARDGVLPGGLTAIVSAVVIVVTTATVGLADPGVYLLEVTLGAVVGAMLWWQMRALAAERQARARAWDQATTAERERIAREIHDLVAHSLSVSLLQVTGARHALRDVTDAPDVAEAARAAAEVDAALADAESVGRQAMADIRRTVSTMAQGPSERVALPVAADIGALVAQVSAAGLPVEYDEQGDPAALSAATGLGLYRIAQESLANVAKHGAGGPVLVRLAVTRSGSRLQVRNPLPAGRPRGDGAGSGLAGMHARAGQLGAAFTAGPDGEDWVVDVRLGAAPRGRAFELPCGRTVGSLGQARTA
ncbi:sensor histidine kinase [Nocardioides caeni]|uniref:histidine kinase n=1 Tax=Nocardioides caeni TaxID=574700 RepID=A0A4V6T5U6_9ACTN|nr:histidine kinase [Nocardioides caeni]THV10506.1 histidine kinase [Nocardioides caeni]